MNRSAAMNMLPMRSRPMRPINDLRGLLDDAANAAGNAASGAVDAATGAASDAVNAAAAAAAGAVNSAASSASASISTALGQGGGGGAAGAAVAAPVPVSYATNSLSFSQGLSLATKRLNTNNPLVQAQQLPAHLSGDPIAAKVSSNNVPATLALRIAGIASGVFKIDTAPVADAATMQAFYVRGGAIVSSSASLSAARQRMTGPTQAATQRGYTMAQAFRGAKVQTGFMAWILPGLQATEQPATVTAFQAAYNGLASTTQTVAAPASASSQQTKMIAAGAVGLAALAAIAYKMKH